MATTTGTTEATTVETSDETTDWLIPLDTPEDVGRRIFGDEFVKINGLNNSLRSMHIETHHFYDTHLAAIEDEGYRFRWVRPQRREGEDTLVVRITRE